MSHLGLSLSVLFRAFCDNNNFSVVHLSRDNVIVIANNRGLKLHSVFSAAVADLL